MELFGWWVLIARINQLIVNIHRPWPWYDTHRDKAVLKAAVHKAVSFFGLGRAENVDTRPVPAQILSVEST